MRCSSSPPGFGAAEPRAGARAVAAKAASWYPRRAMDGSEPERSDSPRWARALKLVSVNVLVFLVLLLLLEAVLQGVALVWPSYDVLLFQPDRVVGWRQVPNLRWTWAGHYWYAVDFSVDIETGPLGFRDLAREVLKPPGVKRVALLGDSFIEAAQVPFDKTAGQLLQRSLNAASGKDSQRPQQWEVLNFGISNYGIGQYLLTWEQYARDFEPDYVVIFVARFHLVRTVSRYEFGAFPASRDAKLWVRPTFRLQDGELIREPAEDFDQFCRIQQDLLDTEFSGHRSRRKKRWIVASYVKDLTRALSGWVRRWEHGPEPTRPSPAVDPEAEAGLLAVNMRIIEELARQAAEAGARLILVDASRYFGDDEAVSGALQEVCGTQGLGYVPLYADLLQANRDGIPTRWSHDAHFNEAGNEILAAALLDWIARSSPGNASP